MSTVYLIRHSQSEKQANPNLKVSSTMGSSLSSDGRKQAHSMADTLKQVSPAVIYSSDYLRTRETADIIAEELEIPHITTEELRESILVNTKTAKRLEDFIRKISNDYPDQVIAIVGHGKDFRSLLIKHGFVKNEVELPAGSIANAGYIVVNIDNGRLRVKEVHIGGPK